jgi:hypothetical protein
MRNQTRVVESLWRTISRPGPRLANVCGNIPGLTCTLWLAPVETLWKSTTAKFEDVDRVLGKLDYECFQNRKAVLSEISRLPAVKSKCNVC